MIINKAYADVTLNTLDDIKGALAELVPLTLLLIPEDRERSLSKAEQIVMHLFGRHLLPDSDNDQTSAPKLWRN